MNFNILENQINQNSLLLELSVARNFLTDLHFISDNEKENRRTLKRRLN